MTAENNIWSVGVHNVSLTMLHKTVFKLEIITKTAYIQLSNITYVSYLPRHEKAH